MCIICFLKDNYQYNLRKSSMLRSDRMEHTLDKYKYTFIDVFKNNLNRFCTLHNNEINIKINNILTEIDKQNIINFFDTLRKVYMAWINSQISKSIELLQQLLKKYKILYSRSITQSDILFRGRKSKDFISHWDMFHIPFNKRYLIENQRYSLTGQPILYLSSSPYGVIRELETTENIRISTFRMAKNVSFNVYENINKFNDIILENKKHTPKDSADYILNNNIISNTEEIKTNFFKMILASCCSFKRREDTKRSSFSEEYILPQVLTLVLKKYKYDGIKYISTKAHTDDNIANFKNAINLLYSNTCLFTNYTEKQSKDVKNVYDRKLYNKFVLSNPTKYNENISEFFYSIEESLEILGMLNSVHIDSYYNGVIASIWNALMDLSDFLKQLNKDAKDIPKELYKTLNLHTFLLRNIILNIKESTYKNFEGGFSHE